MDNSDTAAERLLSDFPLIDEPLTLDFSGYRVSVRSNSGELLERLGDYFSTIRIEAGEGIEVTVIESPPFEPGVEFVDWKREAGKVGRKDAIHDLTDGRLVQKVRTGMLFLQSPHHRIARGPCLENDNQVINFLNSQYMNHLQNRGHLICHAAAAVVGGEAIGIAGFSGGGKSSLMLRLMGLSPEARYLTNDRLFLSRDSPGAGKTQARGIPKLPRVNPGTLVSIPELGPLVSAERRTELLEMPAADLWKLEEKHDVDIDAVYGPGRIDTHAPLGAILVLNWDRNSTDPLAMTKIDPRERRSLLAAMMKSPGPFYQAEDGSFLPEDLQPGEQRYLEVLGETPVWEASGTVNFELAAKQCQAIMSAAS